MGSSGVAVDGALAGHASRSSGTIRRDGKLHAGEEGPIFDEQLLRHTLSYVASRTSREFEVPDVIGFADYLSAPDELVTDLQRRPDVGPLFFFPCPDGGKVRPLAVLTFPDLVMFDAAAAVTAGTTDPKLSRRRVFAARLQKGPPLWKLHEHGSRWPKFRDSSVALLTYGGYGAMRQEDVRQFFPSVGLGVLVQSLRGHRCQKGSIDTVERMLRDWQAYSGLEGLPIGPDASRLLANGLLLPVDSAIVGTGAELRRWMDDMLIFAPDLRGCDAAVEAANVELAKLGLTFSPSKSRKFDDPEAAIGHIEDGLLASLHVVHRRARARMFEALRDERRKLANQRFEEAFQELYGEDVRCPRRFRFLLNRMAEHGNDFAVWALAWDAELANIDPAATGRYLFALGSSIKGKARDDLFGQLGDRPPGSSEKFDALDLHITRALARSELGTDEGRIFEKIALDTTRNAPVRAWAWVAWGRSAAWSDSKGAEAVDAERDSYVRRAAVVPFRGRESVQRKRLLQHLRERHPETRFVAQWVEAA